MLKKIVNDLFFISERIKEINPDYYILFNDNKNSYEVHLKNQFPSSYCLTLPYEELDERCLFYVQKTKIQNIKSILDEIDRENEKQKKENFRIFKNKILN